MAPDTKIPVSVSISLANSKMTSDPRIPSSSVSSKGKEIVQRRGRLLLSFVRAYLIFLGRETIFSANSLIGIFLLYV